jgi:hypothetical protein
MVLLAFSAGLLQVRADNWSYWGSAYDPAASNPTVLNRLATDGTNMYLSSTLNGVYRADWETRQFSRMPMTGFPLWSAGNTNGFAIWNLAVTPRGTVLISGNPVTVISNVVASFTPFSITNTAPVFYYWDESNQSWHPSIISNKTYPYTTSAGNYSIGPDGSIWTCSGFASYAYHSTNEGRSYVAFHIDARVPTNYVPLYSSGGTFGKIFSIDVTSHHEVLVGTETGGFLHSLDEGQTWSSLDPNFTNFGSTNPLGRIGNAGVLGRDRLGNILLQNTELLGQFPGYSNWTAVKVIGYRPQDGSYFKAGNGIPTIGLPPRVVTATGGESFTFMNQDPTLSGGIFRSKDGKHWTQFNDGIPALTLPFAPEITNVVAPGNCIAQYGPLVFVGDSGQSIWVYDTTPPPITNHRPVAFAQNLNLVQSVAANIALSGWDLDGDSLGFTVTVPPQHGSLTGVPPDLTYTSANNFLGLDSFAFVANDGVENSTPILVQMVVNPASSATSTISLTAPTNGSCFIVPTNLLIQAAVNAAAGVRTVNLYHETNLITSLSNAPFVLTWTNVPAGDYTINARVIDNNGIRTWSAPVSIVVLPEVPRLNIASLPTGNMSVSWPLPFATEYLEGSSAISGPWQLVPYPAFDTLNGRAVTIPASEMQYFRLNHVP